MSERLQIYFEAYKESWKNKTKPQVVEEMASWSMETKRIPDPYYFTIRNDGKLISPQTGQLVERSIERVTPLGRVEAEAVDKIQDWDKDKKEGYSFWISPPHEKRSKFTKMVLSEIQEVDGERRLFNRALMFDLSAREALAIANNLSLESENPIDIFDPEQLRSTPVFINSTKEDWMSLLNIKVGDKFILEMIRTGEDMVEKEIAVKKFGVIYDRMFISKSGGYDDFNTKAAVQQAMAMNLFGKFDGSCPPSFYESTTSAFTTMYENAFGGKLIRNCGACKAYLNKYMSAMDTCPHCGGVYRGC